MRVFVSFLTIATFLLSEFTAIDIQQSSSPSAPIKACTLFCIQGFIQEQTPTGCECVPDPKLQLPKPKRVCRVVCPEGFVKVPNKWQCSHDLTVKPCNMLCIKGYVLQQTPSGCKCVPDPAASSSALQPSSSPSNQQCPPGKMYDIERGLCICVMNFECPPGLYGDYFECNVCLPQCKNPCVETPAQVNKTCICSTIGN